MAYGAQTSRRRYDEHSSGYPLAELPRLHQSFPERLTTTSEEGDGRQSPFGQSRTRSWALGGSKRRPAAQVRGMPQSADDVTMAARSRPRQNEPRKVHVSLLNVGDSESVVGTRRLAAPTKWLLMGGGVGAEKPAPAELKISRTRSRESRVQRTTDTGRMPLHEHVPPATKGSHHCHCRWASRRYSCRPYRATTRPTLILGCFSQVSPKTAALPALPPLSSVSRNDVIRKSSVARTASHDFNAKSAPPPSWIAR